MSPDPVYNNNMSVVQYVLLPFSKRFCIPFYSVTMKDYAPSTHVINLPYHVHCLLLL